MLDIIGNIDTVNYFIQDAIVNTVKHPLAVRTNLYQGDGYVVDFNESTKKNCVLYIRSTYRQQLARIMMSKESMILRYNEKFMFIYNTKTGLFSTNFFEETFVLEDMEATFFTQNTMFKFSTDVVFDFSTMHCTLEKCLVLYDAYITYIQTRA